MLTQKEKIKLSIMINIKKTIIITGASSGLGRALSVNYAKLNHYRLFLFGRSAEKLEVTAQLCRQYDAEIHTVQCCVEDQEAMLANIEKIANEFGIDTVIACAGVSAGTLDGPEPIQQVKKIFSTNLDGVINTIMPAIKTMINVRKGNIVIVGSMAGMIGLSSSPAYSASKGAVKMFGDSMRAYLRKYGINVCVAIPGFIKTPMTDVNRFPMPFMIDADTAALKIIHGIDRKRGIIAFPYIIYILLKCLNFLPSSIVTYINSKLPGKPGLF